MARFAQVSENSSTCTFRPKPNMKWEIQPTFFASTWHSTPSPSTLLLPFHRSTTSLFHSKLGLLVFRLILFLPIGFLWISFPANGFWKFPSWYWEVLLNLTSIGSGAYSFFLNSRGTHRFVSVNSNTIPSRGCFSYLGFAVSLQISLFFFFFQFERRPLTFISVNYGRNRYKDRCLLVFSGGFHGRSTNFLKVAFLVGFCFWCDCSYSFSIWVFENVIALPQFQSGFLRSCSKS